MPRKAELLLAAFLLTPFSLCHALELTPLDLAAAGSAAQPNVIADATHKGFVLSWQERKTDKSSLWVAQLSNQGVLSARNTVASGSDWFVNWADMPSVAIADNGDWLTFWLQKNGDSTYAYDIVTRRSRDRGKHWSAPLRPHRDGTQSEHGFVAMAPDGADRIRMIWLDGRATASATTQGTGAAETSHANHHGTMALRSAVLSRGDQISQEVELDANVCSCCWPSLLRTAPGQFIAAYRDRSEAEIRDIALLEHRAGQWQRLGTLHDDHWRIAACPTNGPVLAARGGKVLGVWPTMVDAESNEPNLSVRAKLLGKGAQMQELESGARVLGRPAVAAFAGGWLVAWLGGGGAGESTLRLAHFDAGLMELKRVDVVVLPAGRSIGVPKLAALDDVAMLVWTEALAPSAPQTPVVTKLAGVLIRP